MATKADELKSRTQTANSASKRTARVTIDPARLASIDQKRNVSASRKGRALHARTKSIADAKAAKPGTGKKIPANKTGPNGGEDQTSNGVARGRGADGTVPTAARVSRKSTRGGWPGGEKQSQLTRRTKRAVASPQARAQRALSVATVRTKGR
jgi:hypothetical protein